MSDTATIDVIVQAIRDYHLDLDRKTNVDNAERDCIKRIEAVLDLTWFPGQELERRARIAVSFPPPPPADWDGVLR